MIDGALQPYGLTLDKFLDHAAKWHPQAEVVTAREGREPDRIGYAALRDRARRISTLLAGFGIGQGDRVATLAWNSQAHLECWYAIIGMGAVCHTLNPRLTATELADMLRQSEAKVLVVTAELAELAAGTLECGANVDEVLLIDCDDVVPADTLDAAVLETLIADDTPGTEWGAFDENAPCGLCFTSGTTGAPKGVTYTHRGSYLHTLRQLQADVSGIVATDSILVAVPMFHANAWGLPFSAPAAGAKLVLPGRETTGEALARLIESERVTLGVAVPTVWLTLYDYLDETGMRLPSLERIMVGGAPMPPALARRIEDSGVRVQTSWGMTELSPLGTASAPSASAGEAGHSGRPAIGIDLLLADPEGNALDRQRGSEGHLLVRGHSVVERYFGDRESACDNGWFPTGDLAVIDEDGNLSITGRSKDLIKSGGEWINPAVIEALIGALPQVSHAAVIARPDEKWGERPLLVVEMRDSDPIGERDLRAALDGKVARWWIPDEIRRIDAMPLAATGKIDKLRLRREYSTASAGKRPSIAPRIP